MGQTEAHDGWNLPLARRALLQALGVAAGAAVGAGTPAAGDAWAASGGAGSPGPGTGSGGPLEATALRIGYLPITDATPLLLAHAQGLYAAEGIEAARPTLFRGWAPLAEAFQARQVDVVHLLMPTAVWMRFGQNYPVKVVAWSHTDGSALTTAPAVSSVDDLAGRTVAIPFWYSIHNLVLQLLLRTAALTPLVRGEASIRDRSVKLVVMAPPDMPPALASGAIAGYIVADPFNAVAEVNGVGRILRFTGDAWLNHACCVVVMHEEATTRRPRWAQAVVTALARAQRFAREHRRETARLLSAAGGHYLPQPLPVIERALGHYDRAEYGATKAVQHPDWPNHRIDFQPFPFPTFTEELVRRLRDTVVDGERAFLAKLDPRQAHAALVDDRFARAAITTVGGPSRFGLSDSLARVERVAP